ncbi:OmpA family protein [Flavobacterium sp. KACC 22763]|uniref:OmpA family protein n=1 Tax=Flavobacterium sp. KACC 22763 TaxID=3025668 RepID=UPI0023656D7C|nr:OmpA family protein [Flavobacterium sp. KACC 22763]WDF66360.1 OmpA family protein [Flavobacterium sp. KACC 22763]
MIFKKIKIALVLLCICLVQSGRVIAQDKRLEKANKAYDKFAFIEAAKLYEEQVNKGVNTREIYTKLGDCYYYNGNYPRAVKCYSKILETKVKLDSEYYFRYAQALNNTQNYNEAEKVMKTYYSNVGKNDLSANWGESKLIEAIKEQSGRYTFKPVEINTPFSDFGSAFYGTDKVIYASAKDTGIVIKRKHSWNEKAFLKLYSADVTVDGGLQNPVLLKGDVNTKYHQSTPAITKDGKTMFFTRNNYIDGKLGEDKKGTTYLKIYTAENVNGKWENVKELQYPINSDGFSSAHPALSPDETQLFFVSDRNNSFGNSDLYVVNLKNGKLVSNDVVKLGEEINTPGRETFPFMDSCGILYFASDGHPGLGGLDIFAAIKDNTGKYHVVNLGDGVNSASDDFAYTFNCENKKGYFSSDRSGNDDIYSFTESRPVTFDFDYRSTVFGTITENGQPVSDFNAELFNSKGESVATLKTDSKGFYEIVLDPYQDYKIVFTKQEYAEKTINTELLKPLEKKEISFEITREMEVVVEGEKVKIKEGDDLTDKLKLSPIYFDFNGFNIRQSSQKELDKVVALMKDRPNISIQVNSYTDSRGRDEFNMKLSKNRAKATVDYIIKAGISKDRINGEGFGETHLLNHCSNGVACSEKEHELNRRSEFIISFK